MSRCRQGVSLLRRAASSVSERSTTAGQVLLWDVKASLSEGPVSHRSFGNSSLRQAGKLIVDA